MKTPLETRGSRANDGRSARLGKKQPDGTHAHRIAHVPRIRGTVRLASVLPDITIDVPSLRITPNPLTSRTPEMHRSSVFGCFQFPVNVAFYRIDSVERHNH